MFVCFSTASEESAVEAGGGERKTKGEEEEEDEEEEKEEERGGAGEPAAGKSRAEPWPAVPSGSPSHTLCHNILPGTGST